MSKIGILTLLIVLANLQLKAQPKVLLITGGHDFEQEQFFNMFSSFEQYSYDWVVQPEANELMSSSKINDYDALIFYDMIEEITAVQKKAYIKQLEKGQGMVFLHHALVSYQDWTDFEAIIGGKYVLRESPDINKSTYQHDVDIEVIIADSEHQIIKGLKDFKIYDEVYGNFIVSKSVTPLIKTNHPKSTEIIGWAHRYKNSRVVYLQPGHGPQVFENKHYRELLRNAINWVAE